MADDKDNDEKTEDPTQQRREDFRKRGQVAQTRDLGSVFFLLLSAFLIYFLGRTFLEQINQLFLQSFNHFLIDAARDEGLRPAIMFAIKKAALLVVPVAAIYWLFGIASTLLQVGFVNNEEAIQFNLEKINPVSGLKRMFSLRSVIEGIKSLAKLGIVGFVAYLILKKEYEGLPLLIDMGIGQILVYLGTLSVQLLFGVGGALGVLAAADYFYQRWELEKEMRMTKQELKEEFKSREGDPLIKARIRKIQRETAMRRMMQDVPKADVIITNPTHIAIAIKYSDQMVAPTVIAKGADTVAEKIKEIAKLHSIPVVENKPLARTIYKTIEIGMRIPRELYSAVAEVLAYVYKLKKKLKGKI
jgi:flagellar biosynthetic protein FlhB